MAELSTWQFALDGDEAVDVWQKDKKEVRFLAHRLKNAQLKNLPVCFHQSSVDDSEIYLDVDDRGNVEALCTGDSEFWNIVSCSKWSSSIRVGEGRLLDRLTNTAQKMVRNQLANMFKIVETYSKCSVGSDHSKHWILHHNQKDMEACPISRQKRKDMKSFRISRDKRKIVESYHTPFHKAKDVESDPREEVCCVALLLISVHSALLSLKRHTRKFLLSENLNEILHA